MSVNLGEAHYKLTVEDGQLTGELDRARARVGTAAGDIKQKIGSAADSISASNAKIGASSEKAAERVGAASAKSGKSVKAAAADTTKAADQTAKSYDKLGASADAAAKKVEAASARIGKAAPRVGSNDNLPSDRSVRAGRMNLARQGADVFTSAAMGMSPQMIAIQQGPQILDALAQSGIKVGAGMGIAAAAILAVAGAIAVVGGNVARTEKDMRNFQSLITVTADSSRYSATQMTSVARALDVQGVSAQQARQELAAFLRDGVRPDRLQEFGTAAMEMSKVLGVDVVDAATTLSKAFTGTWDDVKKLDDSLHFLTQTERDHIQTLFDHNKAAEARNEAFRIFSEKYAKAYNESLTTADQLTRNLSGAWDNLVQSLSNTTPIQNATSAIGGLVNQLANWLGQYAQVQNLTKQGLQAESDRLYKKLTDPNAEGKYINESQTGKLRKFAYGPLSWIFAPKTKSPEELRREDEQRMFDVQAALQKLPTTGDTTTRPPVTPPTVGGARYKPPSTVKKTQTVAGYGYQGGYGPDGQWHWSTDNSYGAPSSPQLGKMTDKDIQVFDANTTKVVSLSHQWRDAFDQIGESASYAFGQAAAGMGNFGDIFRRELQQMVAEWAAADFQKFFNWMGDAIFGSPGGGGGGGGSSAAFSLPGFGGFRAAGGPVEPGKSYLVGERGAERFVPRVPGSIVPMNHGGSQPIVFDLRGAVMTDDLLRQMNVISERNARQYSGVAFIGATRQANADAPGTVRRRQMLVG